MIAAQFLSSLVNSCNCIHAPVQESADCKVGHLWCLQGAGKTLSRGILVFLHFPVFCRFLKAYLNNSEHELSSRSSDSMKNQVLWPKMICPTQFVRQEWKHYYRRVTFRNVIEALSRLSKSSTFGPSTRTRPSDNKRAASPKFYLWEFLERVCCGKHEQEARLQQFTSDSMAFVQKNPECRTWWILQMCHNMEAANSTRHRSGKNITHMSSYVTSIPDSNKHFSTSPHIAGWSGRCISLKQLLGLGICGICMKGLWNGDEVKILLLKY